MKAEDKWKISQLWKSEPLLREYFEKRDWFNFWELCKFYGKPNTYFYCNLFIEAFLELGINYNQPS